MGSLTCLVLSSGHTRRQKVLQGCMLETRGILLILQTKHVAEVVEEGTIVTEGEDRVEPRDLDEHGAHLGRVAEHKDRLVVAGELLQTKGE